MRKIQDHFYRVSAKALVLDGKKRFLLTKENNGLWELPGGGLDFKETPQVCLAREIKEETGLETIYISKIPSYFLTAISMKGQCWVANVLYETRLKNFKFTPSDECVEMRYFNVREALEEKLFPSVKEFLKMYNPDNHK